MTAIECGSLRRRVGGIHPLQNGAKHFLNHDLLSIKTCHTADVFSGVNMDQRRDASVRVTGEPRENPPSTTNFRHISHMRKSECSPSGKGIRFTVGIKQKGRMSVIYVRPHCHISNAYNAASRLRASHWNLLIDLRLIDRSIVVGPSLTSEEIQGRAAGNLTQIPTAREHSRAVNFDLKSPSVENIGVNCGKDEASLVKGKGKWRNRDFGGAPQVSTQRGIRKGGGGGASVPKHRKCFPSDLNETEHASPRIYHPPPPEKDLKIRRSLQHGSVRSCLLTGSVAGSAGLYLLTEVLSCWRIAVEARDHEKFQDSEERTQSDKCASTEGIWRTRVSTLLQYKILRADEGEIEERKEQRQNARAETGDTRENRPTRDSIVRHDSHLPKSGSDPVGIEPASPWWEASRLTNHSSEQQGSPLPRSAINRPLSLSLSLCIIREATHGVDDRPSFLQRTSEAGHASRPQPRHATDETVSHTRYPILSVSDTGIPEYIATSPVRRVVLSLHVVRVKGQPTVEIDQANTKKVRCLSHRGPPQTKNETIPRECQCLPAHWSSGQTTRLPPRRDHSHVGIVPDDAAGRLDSSGFFRLSRPYIPALLYTHLASPSLRAVQSFPSTHSAGTRHTHCRTHMRKNTRRRRQGCIYTCVHPLWALLHKRMTHSASTSFFTGRHTPRPSRKR
ncbi:hypothetical protein PR048_010165 [Dryococelus australis]|uniref:Uncharacterized protein n=1 Tax=Dryococelus australis TaxID=614101 RepID=A0ABQ9I1Y8_9NEOP|nr:hypothetical protein PR048_010165 [Dryococelus australis]